MRAPMALQGLSRKLSSSDSFGFYTSSIHHKRCIQLVVGVVEFHGNRIGVSRFGSDFIDAVFNGFAKHGLPALFYHRKLKRLVAIDLKLCRFKARYKGQMELYLRYLEKYESESGENSPIGLILCSEGSKEQIELLQLDNSEIRVAEYWMELPPKELLQKKLHKVIELEREKLQMKKLK